MLKHKIMRKRLKNIIKHWKKHDATWTLPLSFHKIIPSPSLLVIGCYFPFLFLFLSFSLSIIYKVCLTFCIRLLDLHNRVFLEGIYSCFYVNTHKKREVKTKWLHHRCRFLNRQRHSFWLLIFKSAAAQFCCRFLNRHRQSFWLPIIESAAA